MVLDAALAYLHYISLMLVAGFLCGEVYLLKAGVNAQRASQLVRADLIYLISAVLALGSGLARSVWGVKGWSFYAANPLFHSKLTLFVLIAVISIVPTLIYRRWQKAAQLDAAFVAPEAEQKRVRRFLILQLHLLALLPLFGVAMARGFRWFW
jgi:putative membrane protein